VYSRFARAALGSLGSLGFLGRSFSLVAAHRGIRTGGPYRWVRHPVYASYVVAHLGYLLLNPTWWNAAVLVTVTGFQLVRIRHEEALLSEDQEYVGYRDRVRWRLIPFVY
jgi:protein-S-isoprenylcysteine O-methyltransferase Ste14